MKNLAKLSLLTALSLTSLSSFADTLQTLTIGALPATVSYGNSYNRPTNSGSFTDSLGGSFSPTTATNTFYDDFIFTIPDSVTSSFTSSLSFTNLLGLDNLRARIYTGSTHQTGQVVNSAWSTKMILNQFVTLSTVVLEPINLAAGTYTLQIKGDIIGINGGSYAGTMNALAPIPELETFGMLIAGLSIVGMIARRKSKKVY